MKNLYNYLVDNIIYEMSLSKSEFDNQVSNLIDQIIENWCLVRLCDLYHNNAFAICRNHWSSELKSYMKKIAKFNIKTNRKHKYKYLLHIFIDVYELNDYKNVTSIIRNKFNKECLQKYINVISEECANNIGEICRVLVSDSVNDIDEYIDGEIG